MDTGTVTMSHGSGGKPMHNLIRDVFNKYFSNEILDEGNDAAIFSHSGGRLAFTTDSFVVSPLFFKGGDIGKLAVCGTVNDIITSGARPMYLSAGFIIEEGFELEKLEAVVKSMAEAAGECGVKIIAGDTKVVQKGAADGLFINTSGIGFISDGVNISGKNARTGDKVLVTGTLGDHGCTILLERENLGIETSICSDCAPLSQLVEKLLEEVPDVRVLRDPTRGGLATTLNEIASQSRVSVKIFENLLPVRSEVRGVCEMLGLDPLYLANEGKLIAIVPGEDAEKALACIRSSKYGREAAIIGDVEEKTPGRVYMKTLGGGTRIVDMLLVDQIPRIC